MGGLYNLPMSLPRLLLRLALGRRLPITSVRGNGLDPERAPVQGLELELSGRIDHYSNFGYAKNPKIALTWNVGAGLRLRGTAGTSVPR